VAKSLLKDVWSLGQQGETWLARKPEAMKASSTAPHKCGCMLHGNCFDRYGICLVREHDWTL